MTDPKPLPHPNVRYMFDANGRPTQQAYEFLERLVKVAKDANTAIADLQALTSIPFVTQALSGSLSAERKLAVASPITLTDGGANGDLTVGLSAGAVLQVLQNTYATNADLTTTIPYDDTTPTNTEGTQVLSQAITPASASNKIKVEVVVNGGVGTANDQFIMSVWRGSTCIDVKASSLTATGFMICLESIVLDAPATTSEVTYTVRVGGGSGTVRLNGLVAARKFGGAAVCTLTLTEVKG